jgi:hypothetical protein
VVFDTKAAILVLEDLPVWRKLNVTAFLATGIAGAAPEALGEPYVDAAGRNHARLLGQPMLIFAASSETLVRAYRQAIDRGLTRAVYVRAMFATGHDAANRAAFLAEPAGTPDLRRAGAERAEEGCREGDEGSHAAPLMRDRTVRSASSSRPAPGAEDRPEPIAPVPEAASPPPTQPLPRLSRASPARYGRRSPCASPR